MDENEEKRNEFSFLGDSKKRRFLKNWKFKQI